MKITKPQKYDARKSTYKSRADLEKENYILRTWVGYMEYKTKYYSSLKSELICKDLESAIKTMKNDLLTKNTSF